MKVYPVEIWRSQNGEDGEYHLIHTDLCKSEVEAITKFAEWCEGTPIRDKDYHNMYYKAVRIAPYAAP